MASQGGILIKKIFITILMCTLIVIPTNISAEGDFDVSCSFSKNPADAGEWIVATIIVTNKDENQANLTYLGIHFDFYDYPVYFEAGIDEDETKLLAPGQTKTFLITFGIPEDIQSEDYGYGIKIGYYLNDSQPNEWNDYVWYSHIQTGLQVNEKNNKIIDEDTPGFEAGILLIAFLVIIIYKKRKIKGEL